VTARSRFPLLTLAAALLGAAAPALAAPGESPRPPVARKDPKTIELHGDTLTDDYGWLRNKGTPEVEAHLNAELAHASAFLLWQLGVVEVAH
jgi:oligopeptidase B